MSRYQFGVNKPVFLDFDSKVSLIRFVRKNIVSAIFATIQHLRDWHETCYNEEDDSDFAQ